MLKVHKERGIISLSKTRGGSQSPSELLGEFSKTFKACETALKERIKTTACYGIRNREFLPLAVVP